MRVPAILLLRGMIRLLELVCFVFLIDFFMGFFMGFFVGFLIGALVVLADFLATFFRGFPLRGVHVWVCVPSNTKKN